MSTKKIHTHQPHHGRYFWAGSDHFPDGDGDRFIGFYHVAVRVGPQKYSVQRNNDCHDPTSRLEYGTEVTQAYSREEAEAAVRRVDNQYVALQSDEQLELNL